MNSWFLQAHCFGIKRPWQSRSGKKTFTVGSRGWWHGQYGALLAIALLMGACGGPALTPLQMQSQRGEERALRYHARGELSQALQGFQDDLRLAQVTDDRPMIVTHAFNAGMVALALGDLPLAAQCFTQARRVAVGIGDRIGRLQAQLGLAQVELRHERWGAAQTEFQQALAEARDLQDSAALLVALNGLGLAQKGLGDRAGARRYGQEAEAQARTSGAKRLLAATLANQAALDLQEGKRGQAATALKEAIALDRELENLPGLAQDLGLLAQVHQQEGRIAEALELYHQAQTIVRHTGQRALVQHYDQQISRLKIESSAPSPSARLE